MAHAQYKFETCGDLKITEKRYGVNVIETATCVNPTKALSPKGTLRNVNILYSFPPVPTGAAVTFMVQGPDGKDVAFVNEYQQNIGEQNRKYATVGDQLRLPAGVYSVYIIAWGKRETMKHRGNLTEYFAKMTLTVK